MILAGNFLPIAYSSLYASELLARKGIVNVVKNVALARIEDQTKETITMQKNPKFEVFIEASGAFRFRLRAKNGDVIIISETYKAKASCLNGVKSVMRNVVGAEIYLES